MITQARLKELLYYDMLTGLFFWRVARAKNVKVGDIAGWIKDGYVCISIFDETYYAHRLAMLYVKGYIPEEVDHKDLNRSNNRWFNLRDATASNNQHNKGLQRNNTSGVKGVSWSKAFLKWHVRIHFRSKCIHVGYFENIDDAKIAYADAAKIHHKNFMNVG